MSRRSSALSATVPLIGRQAGLQIFHGSIRQIAAHANLAGRALRRSNEFQE